MAKVLSQIRSILKIETGEWKALVDPSSLSATWLIPLSDLRSPKNPSRIARPVEILLEKQDLTYD